MIYNFVEEFEVCSCLLSCNCGHLSSVSMFVTELVLWNLLQVYLAALRWAISSLLMLDLVWGSQTQLLYSNFGPIKDVYAFSFTFFCIDTKLAYIFIYWICCRKIRFRKALRAKKHVKSVHRNMTNIVITTVIVNKFSLIIRHIKKISAKHT
jgi:hypothetical protein